ncbi:MAG TPA: Calx-beta domain-containing protein [Thermoanaerobaculia bacterium]
MLDPGTITFAETSQMVLESAGVATIQVQRGGGTSGAVSVAYAVAGGTATAGSDLESVSGVLTWADGESGSKSFQVPILGDQVAELDETVVFTLSGAAGGAALGSPASTMLTIRDDDGPSHRRRVVRH